MKLRLNPTEIVLKDLPPEGRNFEFTQESGELNDALKDLIGLNAYDLKFHLSPMGNTFDLKGHLSTKMDLQCSLCAEDYKQPVELNLHEYIVIERALGKNDQGAKSNHAHEWESGGPDYIVLNNDTFNVGEYVHEAIGLAEPIRPLCAPEKPEGCANAGQRIEREWLSFNDEKNPKSEIRANPFQVLEKLKLKS
ncbi:MAG: DUF177 domain-containing protein [Bdellovibrionales bacterium]|nr:DUF177 domain-containing protein [Bdellovibrionales bacterium]